MSATERQSERYEVITETLSETNVPSTLNELYVRSGSDELVAMGNLVNIEETVGPSEIHHYNRLRAATISASTPPNVALGTALAKLQDYVDESLPAGFNTAVTGESQDFQESFYYLTITVVFSIVFIFLVLAAQFESLLHPFTILLALPLAAVGAFGSLWVLDMPMSVYAFIGLIMLLGLVTKNAILLVDYTIVLEKRGLSTTDAAKQAANIRFRPVLMTAFSTVLGMTPIALGFGAGGEARAPLGISVAAGMTVATLLTLVVIPVVYTLFDQLQNAVLGLFSRKPRTEPAGVPA